MAEILTSESIPKKPKKAVIPKQPENELPQWCMHCRFYKNSKKKRPLMECRKRGGTRQPNAGETCEYFERKQ